MSELAPKSIIIVGGGASATLLLAQLSTQLNAPAIITVIDDSKHFNQGLAYSVEHPSFILNVPANRMGAWCDKPDDFYHWLTHYPQRWRHLHNDFATIQYHEEDFVPRMIYGAYLRWIHEHAVARAEEKNIRIQKICAKVSNISDVQHSLKLLVTTSNHEVFNADAVIIATGNSIPKNHHISGKNIFTSPYHPDFINQDWTNIKNLLVIGSGLSMVDAVQFLSQHHYKGNIQVFSCHGLVPLPHMHANLHQDCPAFAFKDLESARAILRKIRVQIDQNSQLGISWQTTINSLRAHTNAMWLSLSAREKSKLRRLSPWWNVVRHRIPKAVHDLLIKLQSEKKLTITKGDVRQVENDGDYFLINLYKEIKFIKADKVVVCSGYSYDQQLKTLCGDLLNSEATHSQQRISKNHELYAIGPALGTLLFETTAIHEIRQQSLNIAKEICTKKH